MVPNLLSLSFRLARAILALERRIIPQERSAFLSSCFRFMTRLPKDTYTSIGLYQTASNPERSLRSCHCTAKDRSVVPITNTQILSLHLGAPRSHKMVAGCKIRKPTGSGGKSPQGSRRSAQVRSSAPPRRGGGGYRRRWGQAQGSESGVVEEIRCCGTEARGPRGTRCWRRSRGRRRECECEWVQYAER